MSLVHDAQLLALGGLRRVLRRASPARSKSVAAALARSMVRLGGKHVGYGLMNMHLAFPERSEDEIRALLRHSYEHLAWNVVDVVRSLDWEREQVCAHVGHQGIEHLKGALSRGQGALVLAAHIGNFELAAQAWGWYDLPATIISRAIANRRINDLLIENRSKSGSQIVPHHNVVPKILRALKAGRAIAILNDQYSRRARGVFVPLFGARCSTSSGIATLALRTGAPVVPTWVLRDADDHHTMHFGAEIPVERRGELRADVERVTAQFNTAIESMIRAHPEQWMWAHRRFRHSPDLPDGAYGRPPFEVAVRATGG